MTKEQEQAIRDAAYKEFRKLDSNFVNVVVTAIKAYDEQVKAKEPEKEPESVVVTKAQERGERMDTLTTRSCDNVNVLDVLRR